jgi:hypothetical protein
MSYIAHDYFSYNLWFRWTYTLGQICSIFMCLLVITVSIIYYYMQLQSLGVLLLLQIWSYASLFWWLDGCVICIVVLL